MTVVRSSHRKHEREYFYKYATLDTARRIIVRRTLRWSSPLLFNDPFDIPRDARLSFSVDELQEAIVAEFLRALEGKEPTSNPGINYLAKQFRTEGDTQRRRAVLEEIRRSVDSLKPVSGASLDQFLAAYREYAPGLRILCLSEVHDCVPMWSHYSDSHRGAVLKFVCSDELDSSLLLAQPVRYQDAPPSLPPKETWAKALVSGKPIDWQEFFTEYYYVKLTSWSYEREWRVISYSRPDEPGFYLDREFLPPELAAVYLGTEVSDEDASAILGELQNDFGHVELYRGRLVRDERRIAFEQSKGESEE